MGKITAGAMGENNYELARLEKGIFYAKYWYYKQYLLTRMSREIPDVTNAFGVLAKEDTSHGFPVWSPSASGSTWLTPTLRCARKDPTTRIISGLKMRRRAS